MSKDKVKESKGKAPKEDKSKTKGEKKLPKYMRDGVNQ